MATLADLEYAYLGTLGATGTTLLDRRREIYGESHHAYYSNASGLTPKNLYSLADHQSAFWAVP